MCKRAKCNVRIFFFKESSIRVNITTFTDIFVQVNVPQIYIYTTSSPKANMPCKVTRAGGKTMTQVARSHTHFIFSGKWSKKAYVG